MLPSFDFSTCIDQWILGTTAALTLLRLTWRCTRCSFVRVVLSRPLWWLGARLLAVPDASARYAHFRDQALARWEALLLDGEPDQVKRSLAVRRRPRRR